MTEIRFNNSYLYGSTGDLTENLRNYLFQTPQNLKETKKNSIIQNKIKKIYVEIQPIEILMKKILNELFMKK